MKKNRLYVCLLMFYAASQMMAQGLVVHKKDGTTVKYFYESIDSIVTFDYDEMMKEENNRRTYRIKNVSFTMIAVEGGTFTMGATSEQTDANDDEYPTHKVTLSDYYIGETEVTQELWNMVMGTSYPSSSQLPVVNVSWNDCQEFITKLNELTGQNFKLPTEAQWEYAARGGKQSKGYRFSGSNNLEEVAWYSSNSSRKTHDVKTKFPNELGLYDMSGNVYEWCSDWYGGYSYGAVTDPTGPSTGEGKVFRGGNKGCEEKYCRVSYRNKGKTTHKWDGGGFRLAL